MTDAPLVLMPKWDACLAQWELLQPEVTAIFGDRISPTPPPRKVYPYAVVTLLSDPPVRSGLRWLVRATVQHDVWAEKPSEAWHGADTLRALLAARFQGQPWTVPAGSFVAAGVLLGGIAPSISTAAIAGATKANEERFGCRFTSTLVLHPRP